MTDLLADALARAIGGDADPDEHQEWFTTPRRFGEGIAEDIRALPADQRARIAADLLDVEMLAKAIKACMEPKGYGYIDIDRRTPFEEIVGVAGLIHAALADLT